ncbi:MAG TPA: diguanylate cyclase [Acidimicrobiales bacterium]|nr:diguanylate cyclase [Acidimicrobiales bacterium]
MPADRWRDGGGAPALPAGSVTTTAVRHRLLLSLRSWLLLVVVTPIAATVAFASTTAASSWTSRQEAVGIQHATLRLKSLVELRTALSDELVPTAATVYASQYHVEPAELDSLIGVNFQADLKSASTRLAGMPILRSIPVLANQYGDLLRLESRVARGSASYGQVQAVFQEFGAAVDALWDTGFDGLTDSAASSASPGVSASLNELNSTYTAFTFGLATGSLAQTVLTTPSSPKQVEALIVANQQFQSAVDSFAGQLGPDEQVVWKKFEDSAQDHIFNSSLQLAILAGLNNSPPPFMADMKSHTGVFKADINRANALRTVVLAAAADLVRSATGQQDSATRRLSIDLTLMILLLVVAIGGAVILSRAVRAPLARIASAAVAVHDGDFDLPLLESTGPKELALAANAFNEMSSTLRAVEAVAVALSANDLDDPTLKVPLPGRTGQALQSAIDRLQESVRQNEEKRELLHDRAVHDSLTGLLNRGAAVEALERDLARARRSGETLAVLFIDLDGLKLINDTTGHEGGDAAIRSVGEALRSTTREADVVARIGGDEFVVGWLGQPAAGGHLVLAERILKAVAREVPGPGPCPISVACSIGVALSTPFDTVDTLMSRADEALYAAKFAGRGRFRLATSRPGDEPAAMPPLIGASAT